MLRGGALLRTSQRSRVAGGFAADEVYDRGCVACRVLSLRSREPLHYRTAVRHIAEGYVRCHGEEKIHFVFEAHLGNSGGVLRRYRRVGRRRATDNGERVILIRGAGGEGSFAGETFSEAADGALGVALRQGW